MSTASHGGMGTGSVPQPASSDGPAALPEDKRVGFALVGLGKFALEELLPSFAECKLSRVTALVSGDRAKAERTAKKYGVDSAHLYDYSTFDRLRDDPLVQVVYVVLPNSMHAEYTIRAAQAGKHVLCEKPLAVSVEECDQMIAACAQAQKLLMTAYRLQYEPFNREAIRLVRSGELGKLRNIVASNGQMQKSADDWRVKRAMSGGGPLPDVGIYCLNAARYLTGEEPIEVSALQYSPPGDPRFTEVEEQIDFALRFPSGALAACATSYNTHDSKEYRVLCERGWIELDPGFAYRGLKMRVARTGDGKKEDIEEPRIGEQNQFALEIDHMAQCVLENKKPFTPGEEGRQDVRLIQSIYEAAASGRTVKLPAVPGLDAFRSRG